MGLPRLPYLPREFRSPFRWRRPDHLHRGRYGHLFGFPFHAHDGGEPLAQAGGALRGGVVLPGASAKP